MHKQPNKEKQSTATVLVKHQIAQDKHQLFEAWLKKISQTAQSYSGYLGTETMRPVEASDHNHVCIFRFDTYKNLERWIACDDRRRLLHELDDLASSKPSFVRYTGSELSFPPSTEAIKPPSRHKMALVTFFSIWALVHIIMNYVHPLIPGSALVREMLVIAIIVLLMTYAVMPLLTKLLSKWPHK